VSPGGYQEGKQLAGMCRLEVTKGETIGGHVSPGGYQEGKQLAGMQLRGIPATQGPTTDQRCN